MADTTSTTTQPSDRSGAENWIGGAGLALIAAGLIAAVVMWSDMSGDDLAGYTSVDKWQAVLSGLLVSGLGVLVVAAAVIVSRLSNR